MSRRKSPDPSDRMGVLNCIDDVPDHHRLARYAARYEGRNVWQEFCETQEYEQGTSARFQEAVDREGTHWQEHMADRRHHALATPADVEAWCDQLLSEKSVATAYKYWVRIKRFYDWLQWHVAHPHVYTPVLMAVIDGSASATIWEQKLRKWRQAQQRYEESA